FFILQKKGKNLSILTSYVLYSHILRRTSRRCKVHDRKLDVFQIVALMDKFLRCLKGRTSLSLPNPAFQAERVGRCFPAPQVADLRL
ncbi:MAG: hypothetical protein LBP72_04680, partial [Dysgonamonadaceae bacterium]|nr:hypothetical protein [Dysgonamonadaceae bacterium]